MEINRLLADELNYEVMIKDLELDPLSELSVCSAKLDELVGYAKMFDNANADNEYKKIKVGLLHVNDHLEKVAADPMTERKKQHLQFY
ncbi:hypothetical protein ILUMI_02643 [Ignelater luminosus]|uniref:Uncharacterized protein n=1 Tax=Ignelater luminosus TaxID=2038154 RepID=A0A8K0DH91_IGNLU|nr:hypothetical protein ILUMI_02643 [Ignelater luminosus]